MSALENTSASQAAGPLNELLETYNQCLVLGRDFIETKLKLERDSDPDLWEEFLSVRADLFDFAATSFHLLDRCPSPDEDDNPAERQELTTKVLAALGEMAVMEDELAAFLGASLERLKATILAMRDTQPVFKRYSQAAAPSNSNLLIHQIG